MRIGVYGGTFDPIHIGHLIMASLAKEQLELQQIWLVPAYRPPHKDTAEHHPASDFDCRLEMVKLAIEGRAGFYVSDIEGRRQKPSYTYDTLIELQRENPDVTWVFLCGADSLASIDSWYRAKDILDTFHIGVFRRPGYDPKRVDEILKQSHLNRNHVSWVDTPELDISSTWLRQRLQAGKEVAELIPVQVQRYIKEQRLYE
jgi:nicotinate-nucleotide adenylyltransferase